MVVQCGMVYDIVRSESRFVWLFVCVFTCERRQFLHRCICSHISCFHFKTRDREDCPSLAPLCCRQLLISRCCTVRFGLFHAIFTVQNDSSWRRLLSFTIHRRARRCSSKLAEFVLLVSTAHNIDSVSDLSKASRDAPAGTEGVSDKYMRERRG